ncbi:MAG TPA: HNH endonuclease [Burkholderiaceae bacterium]
MAHGPTKYTAKNYCIYCGITNVRLTDEHIVPLALGGQHILLQASCDACADITKKFEQDVARDLWGDARAAYGAPTRRKKERKKTQILHDPDGTAGPLEIPIWEYPGVFVFYTMSKAGLLNGIHRNNDRSRDWGLIAVTDDNRLEKLQARHPGRVTAHFRNVPDSFARTLAKIGYCQIMASLDIGDFSPLCLDLIFGKEKNISFVVGGNPNPVEPAGFGYQTATHLIGNSERRLLVSEIRLLANCHTPEYHVVVGEITGRDKIREVEEKIAATFSVIVPDEFAGPLSKHEGFHWLPLCWPPEGA